MAVTVTRSHVQNPDFTRSKMRMICRITGPTTYTAGGEAVNAATFGLGTLEALIPSGGTAINATTGILLWTYNPTTGKIVYSAAGGAESSGDLSLYKFDVEAVGR